MIEAFLLSLTTVGVAELGDKTQLLVLMLARRIRRPVLIGAALVAALAISNLMAALFGAWIDSLLPDRLVAALVGSLFIAIGVWTALGGDGSDDLPERRRRSGLRVFASVFFVFVLAELGDKSQLTTAGISAALPGWWAIALGATLGGVLVNLPVIWLGHGLQSPRLATAFRRGGAALFLLIGMGVIWGGVIRG